MPAITSLGAAALARLIRCGELKSAEVVEAHLTRAEKLNPEINAITDLQADRARKLARETDSRWSRQTISVPLPGIPVTIKSSIAAQGFRQECGTPLRQGETASEDAPLVARLKSAGAIVVGSTNVPEFLMAYETDNSIHGRTNSPLDTKLTPGGSSGGCSAAVAAGFSAGSIGSDAGGSVRVPAHFCGLCGLKPTPGAIPRSGHWPAVAGPSTILAGVGPIARTAEDLHLLLSITTGCDPDDILASQSAVESPRPWEKPGDLKIGWFDHAWNTPVTPETRWAVQHAVRALCEHGYPVDHIEPRGLDQAPSIWRQQFTVCLKTLIEASIPNGYRLHPLAYDAMATDEEESATGYRDLLTGWVHQDQLRWKLLDLMKEYPIVLCPVAAVPAFPHGQRSWTIDGERVSYPDVFVYSQVFNLLGVPAATVPVGQSREGLPIGVQIVGRPWEDFVVTRLAIELEAALGEG